MIAAPVCRLTSDGSEAELVPSRGGIATRLFAKGREILSLDAATLADPSKNVRGGVPVLFPSPGKLEAGPYAMKQHGFARDLPWAVAESGHGHATLTLDATDETRRLYPFEFRLTFTYVLERSSLLIRQAYENRGTEEMPFAAGFHPYLLVPDAEKAGTTITTAATRAFDNVTKTDVPFTGFDLTRPEVDLHLEDHGSTRSVLTRPGGRAVEITCSGEFTHWVVWTLAGRDFVCLEPWTAPADALHTGEGVLTLSPGETRHLWTRISAL